MAATASAGAVSKRLMYVNRRAPHGTIYALEGLEVVLIGTAFDQQVSLAFIDDGVYQLKKGQETAAVGMKNYARAYRALADYDVERIYVEQESLTARGLTPADLLVAAEILTAAELAELMARQDVILNF